MFAWHGPPRNVFHGYCSGCIMPIGYDNVALDLYHVGHPWPSFWRWPLSDVKKQPLIRSKQGVNDLAKVWWASREVAMNIGSSTLVLQKGCDRISQLNLSLRMFFEIRLCRPFSRSFQGGVSGLILHWSKGFGEAEEIITFPFGEVDELQCFGGHTEFLTFTVLLHTPPPSSLPDFLICMFRWLCVTVALCFNWWWHSQLCL